eukprot:366295-Chlamydomonas_euryale.AAC.8
MHTLFATPADACATTVHTAAARQEQLLPGGPRGATWAMRVSFVVVHIRPVSGEGVQQGSEGCLPSFKPMGQDNDGGPPGDRPLSGTTSKVPRASGPTSTEDRPAIDHCPEPTSKVSRASGPTSTEDRPAIDRCPDPTSKVPRASGPTSTEDRPAID